MDRTAALLSLRLALATTAVLVVLGPPLAWWLARTRSRFRVLVDALVSLPLVLPPTVLGFYLLMALGPRGPVGTTLDALGLPPLAFSFGGLLLGASLANLPFAVRPFSTAFGAIDQGHLDAALCLGASRTGAFFRVAVPMARRGLLSGTALVFAHVLGEFGVVLMIGGNIPGVTRTLSIAIYDDVQALDYARAAETSAWLVAGSFVLLAGLHAFERGGRR